MEMRLNYLISRIEELIPAEVDKLKETKADVKLAKSRLSWWQHYNLKAEERDRLFIQGQIKAWLGRLESSERRLKWLKNKENGVKTNGYDIVRLKRAPIKNVAEAFGIHTARASRNRLFIKLRAEKTPSCCLYLDTNSYYDFGSSEGGDVIDLVSKLNKCDFKSACRYLEVMGY